MAVAVYQTPTMVVSSLLCVRCRRLGRLADACEEDPEEAALAEALLGQAERYCAAVALRDASLQAADRYYHALMEYQWRLNALDVQLHAVEAAGGGAELPAAGAAEQQRRHVALDQCLTDIQREHALAISALEERASHYAVSAPAAATFSLDRIAASEAERLAAVESYRRLAGETFGGAAREAEELLEAGAGEEGLQRLRLSLERRRGFWHSELDDAWAAWRDVTEAMHRAGDEAVAAWEELSFELASGRPRALLRKGSARPELRRALAAFAARALEVELLSSPALSGLCPERALAEEVSEESPRSPSSAAARLSLLTSVLELLRGLAALHEVGDALLSQDSAPAASSAGFGAGRAAPERSPGPEGPPPRGPPAAEEAASSSSSSSGPGALEATPTAGAAVRLAAAVQVTPAAAAGRLAATPEEGQGVGCLLPWLAECLVEALCEAARQHDREKVQTIIRLCHSLGRSGLADAICDAAGRKRALRNGGLQQARGGRTPLLTSLEELAEAEGEAPGGGGADEREWEACPCPRKCGRYCCGLPEHEGSARKPKPVPAA